MPCIHLVIISSLLHTSIDRILLHIYINISTACDCRVEIMEFTNNDRLSYCKENLSYEKFKMVTTFLHEHPIFDSYCYIPLHLINFLSLVECDVQLPVPETQTELTGNTIRLTIAHNRKSSEKLSFSILQDKEIAHCIYSCFGL